MRVLAATGLALFLTASTAMGQGRTVGDPRDAVRSRTPTTLRYLNERIEEVSFEGAPLDQVMNWLSDLTRMNVVVRWQILDDAGIERDKPITMNVRNLRLSQVLWMIMDEAGGPDLKLAYRASGELLIISSAEDLGREMVVRVYDVSDLLVRAPRFRGAPRMDIGGQQGGLGGQGGSQNIFGGSQGGGGRDDDDDDRGGRGDDDDADIQELIELIIQTVEPDSWADNGGLGTIQSFRNLLVVRNNILVHQALGGYVEESQ